MVELFEQSGKIDKDGYSIKTRTNSKGGDTGEKLVCFNKRPVSALRLLPLIKNN